MTDAFELHQAVDPDEIRVVTRWSTINRSEALDLADALTKWACTITSD